MAINDLYLQSDAEKGETPISKNLRLRSDNDKTQFTYFACDTSAYDSRIDDPPDAADITSQDYTNDGTYFYVTMNLNGAPDTSSYTYVVYMDYPANGTVNPDYRMVYSSGTSELEQMSDSTWSYVKDITITVKDTTKIEFKVALEDFGYPAGGNPDMHLWCATYDGANSEPATGSDGANMLDRDLVTGYYTLTHEQIPEIPWPLPLLFIPALVIAMYIIWRKKFSHANRSHSPTKLDRGDKA